MRIEEIEIPVPWGHVSAKTWGNKEDEHVIVIHGIVDNAGSFDNLIPLLPCSFYYVCVDLPGHGRSSHFEPSCPIHSTNYLLVHRIIVEHFKKEKYIWMAHSFGGLITYMFAQMCPNYIKKLILFDSVVFLAKGPEFLMKRLAKSFDLVIQIQNSKPENQQVFTYEDALNLIMDKRSYGQLTRKSAEPMLRRMIRKVADDQYVFTFDQRLTLRIDPCYNYNYLLDLLNKHPVTCPILILMSSKQGFYKSYGEVHDIMMRFDLILHTVDGDHDMHNTEPEKVAPFVVKFLTKEKNKL